MGYRLFCILTIISGFFSSEIQSQPLVDHRFGFVGEGGKEFAERFQLQYYTLEGNYCLDLAQPACAANPDVFNSTNPANDPPQAPFAHSVIREVAKLNVRNDNLGETNERFFERYTSFGKKRFDWHANPFDWGKRPRFTWFRPNPQALITKEEPAIVATIQREMANGITGTIWEIGNEPNLLPSITPAEYADIYTRYHRVIKGGNPNARVAIGPFFMMELVDPDMRSFINMLIYARASQMKDPVFGLTKYQAQALSFFGLTAASSVIGAVVGGAATGTAIGAASAGFVGAAIGFVVGAAIAAWIDRAFNETNKAARNTLIGRLFQYNTVQYFNEVLTRLPNDVIPDLISLHAYPFDDINPFLSNAEINQQVNAVVTNVRTSLNNKFGVNRPVIISEFGNINPNKTNEAEILSMEEAMVDNFIANPNIESWMWYKPVRQDDQFLGIKGVNPPLTRLVTDPEFVPSVADPVRCADLNTIGRNYVERAIGTVCADPPGLPPRVPPTPLPKYASHWVLGHSDFPEIRPKLGISVEVDSTQPTPINAILFSWASIPSQNLDSIPIGLDISLNSVGHGTRTFYLSDAPISVLQAIEAKTSDLSIQVVIAGTINARILSVGLYSESPTTPGGEAPDGTQPISLLTFSDETDLEDFDVSDSRYFSIQTENGNSFLGSTTNGLSPSVQKIPFAIPLERNKRAGSITEFRLRFPDTWEPDGAAAHWQEFNTFQLSFVDSATDTMGFSLTFKPHSASDLGQPDFFIQNSSGASVSGNSGRIAPYGNGSQKGWVNIKVAFYPTAPEGDGRVVVYYGENGVYFETPVLDAAFAMPDVFADVFLKYSTGQGGLNYRVHIDDLSIRYNTRSHSSSLVPLRLELKDNGYYEGNITKPQVKIKNVSATKTLEGFKVRFWFSKQEHPSQTVIGEKYYSNPSDVTLNVSAHPDNSNLVYLEAAYPGGFTLEPGQSTTVDGLQLAAHYQSYWPGLWDKSNDWSFNGVGPNFALVQNVTVYNSNGDVVFGVEPNLMDYPPFPPPSTSQIFGFEVTSGWTPSTGQVSINSVHFSQGQASLEVRGAGYLRLVSTPTATNFISQTGSSISVDLWVGPDQPNPYWIGQAQLFAHCPSAGINSVYMGSIELTGMPFNQFSALNFSIPGSVQQVISEQHPDFQFEIILNTNSGSGPYLLDNLRRLN